MTIPNPRTEKFEPERGTLLHWWADAYDLDIRDWGATDAERPSEFVELLIDIGQATLTTGLGALATGYVHRFLESRKVKTTKAPAGEGKGRVPSSPPDVRPLMALTIVNESGGTVVVLNSNEPDEIARTLQRATNPKWRGNVVIL